MNIRKVGLLILFMSILFLAACGGNDSDSTQASESDTMTVEHKLGNTDVPKNPEKVVVFDYGILDSLGKMGVEVAGVPQASLPPYLSKYESDDYENVGSLKEPDFEKIAEINPDLIIISGRQQDLYEKLSDISPTIYLGVDTTRYMESFKENMNVLGKVFEQEEFISEELAKIEDSISQLKESAKSVENSLIVLSNEGSLSAYGPESRFGIIHDVFGLPAVAEDIEVSTHGQSISFEYLVEKDPEHLYVIDRTAAIGGDVMAKEALDNELVKKTRAYQNDKITYLDPNYWYLSGGGLMSVSEMISEIKSSLE
ncbi:iron complex transport system substrate-binding protein [Salinibacillus kushneri]|uniref:Iron complex transport system substrate-binding protein n=1 Tax=Salinibacillus kushneri TaxID=237682 RepID=A0A1H9YE99_9BACI|nr:siderophore ABC transporter substrate-binding protein [Salinibacillus kushneri]SES67192.1 iron complex transport system substrate-binding protein [Salinibacillus kushneri]